MFDGRRIAVVLPAYNAAKTLRTTCDEIPRDIVDDIILTDDASRDGTVALAHELGLHTLRHGRNRGYGGNQKTCYAEAFARGADIVVMLHPDYQYSPKLIPAMVSMLVSGHYDAVLASRILGGGTLSGGMPLYKYVANRALTLTQNILMKAKLSEYHTVYRAWDPVPCLSVCHWSDARTISSSTTRCWRWSCILVSGWEKSLARRSILPRHRPSTCRVA